MKRRASTPFDQMELDAAYVSLALVADLAWCALRRAADNRTIGETFDRIARQGLDVAELEAGMSAALGIAEVPREESVRVRRVILHFAAEPHEKRRARHAALEALDADRVRVALAAAVDALAALVMTGSGASWLASDDTRATCEALARYCGLVDWRAARDRLAASVRARLVEIADAATTEAAA